MHFAMPLESELAALCQPLLRFAKLQLRNDAVAEDVVSETIIAILEKPANFEGRSSLRTYATGAFAGRPLLPLTFSRSAPASRARPPCWRTSRLPKSRIQPT